MFEIPARRKEFEQLWECFNRYVSAVLLTPVVVLFFLKAENNFCHFVNGAAVAAAAVDVDDELEVLGDEGPPEVQFHHPSFMETVSKKLDNCTNFFIVNGLAFWNSCHRRDE
jgi:hypothetical protein